MALKKDQVIVWFSQADKGDQKQFFVLACPYARIKDVENRLQAASIKKVKGSRLDHLDPSKLDAGTFPFVEEYLDTVYRIADLSGFGASIPAKAGQLEAKVLCLIAAFLKEQYPGCEFVIRYDERKIRPSIITTWIRKNQLAAIQDPTDTEAAIGLETARLMGAFCERPEQELLQPLYAKVRAQSLMARKWKLAHAADLYLAMVDPASKEDVKVLFENIPELVSQGGFEKWLKKKVSPSFLSKAADLAGEPEYKELILTSNPGRLEAQYETIKASQKKAERPFPREDFDLLADCYASHFVSLLDPAKTKIQKEDWKDKIRAILDAWMDNPEFTGKDKESLYLRRDQDTLKIVSTTQPECLLADLNLGLEIENSRAQCVEMPVDQLEPFLERISQSYPIPKLYIEGPLFGEIRKWSIENNRFLPLYDLEKEHEQLFKRLPQTARNYTYPPVSKVSGTCWFHEDVQDSLEKEDLEFLTRHLLNAQETRLLASCLAAGLSKAKAESYLSRSRTPFYSLVRSYLFSSKVQRFLDRRHFAAERAMLLKPNLSLSAMKRIHQMVMNGIPVDWLNTNLAGGMSLSAIDRLEAQYPYGVLPYSWQTFVRMPQPLQEWMIAKAQSVNPKLDDRVLQTKLNSLNENLAAIMLKKAE